MPTGGLAVRFAGGEPVVDSVWACAVKPGDLICIPLKAYDEIRERIRKQREHETASR